jgi:hypothetical protein
VRATPTLRVAEATDGRGGRVGSARGRGALRNGWDHGPDHGHGPGDGPGHRSGLDHGPGPDHGPDPGHGHRSGPRMQVVVGGTGVWPEATDVDDGRPR